MSIPVYTNKLVSFIVSFYHILSLFSVFLLSFRHSQFLYQSVDRVFDRFAIIMLFISISVNLLNYKPFNWSKHTNIEWVRMKRTTLADSLISFSLSLFFFLWVCIELQELWNHSLLSIRHLKRRNNSLWLTSIVTFFQKFFSLLIR